MPISYRAAQTLIKRGDEDALRTALEAGLNANLVNDNGWSLLMLAAVEGATPIGKLLLEHGADPATTNRKGDTALTVATHRGYNLFVDMLHEHGAP